ncbi:hypothetical protein ACS0TY_018148 [Phlomoides rotata]
MDWNSSNDCTTFFFQNFPESCDWQVLYKKFNTVDRVRDIYIYNRVDKTGCRFSFVRFGDHVNRESVQMKLDDIGFGTYKLRANVSRYNRTRDGRDLPKQRKEADIPKNIFSSRFGDRTFAEAVSRENRASKITPPQNNQNWGGMLYESSEEDRKLLNRSFLSVLKEEHLWIDIGSKIQEAGEGNISVNNLGRSLVFIQPTKSETIKIEDLECVAVWFDYIQQWSDDVIDNNRIIWTNWFGVPMHAWNPIFFNLVSSKFGKLFRIDENTLQKRKLQMARILIRTPYHELP